MIKRYLFFCQLALLPALGQAQFVAGSDGFFIAQDTQVSLNGLTLKPSTDFSIFSKTLTISSTPIAGTPPSISRVYSLSSPVNFAGVVGLFYQNSELNGNVESTLKFAHGNATSVSVAGGTVDLIRHYVSISLPATNFTFLTAAQPNALPVNLIRFQVKRQENVTTLKWQTSQEKNSDYFEIQHSIDSRRWTTLGTVIAAGESQNSKEYLFQDAGDKIGVQYYRLKMVDLDASFAYSTIRQIDIESETKISLYPNPVVDKMRITSKEDLVSLHVTDLAGHSLLWSSSPAPDKEYNLKSLVAGTYLVTIQTVSGKIQTLKIIKQ